MDEYDFIATVQENKSNGQLWITIPKAVSHKYKKGIEYQWKSLER